MTQESPLIICFGDSLTAGFQSPTGENPQGRDTPYGTVLQDKLGSRARVAVSGICGELTGEMAMRFRDDVLRHAPAYVIILGGTNDLGLNAKPADIMRSLLKMYELARSAGIEPVAVSVPSLRVNEHPEGGAGLDWVQDHVDRRVALNRLIADYCVSKGIPFVDFFAATSDAETLLLTAVCSNDGLHLTTEGYARLAHLVYREVLGPKVAQSQGHSSQMIRDIMDYGFDRVVEQATVPVLVEFWQPGCGACRALLGELEKIREAVGDRLLLLKMNVQENYQIPAELEISSLPALALYRKGRFDRFIGGIGKKEEILKQLGLEVSGERLAGGEER